MKKLNQILKTAVSYDKNMTQRFKLYTNTNTNILNTVTDIDALGQYYNEIIHHRCNKCNDIQPVYVYFRLIEYDEEKEDLIDTEMNALEESIKKLRNTIKEILKEN